MITVEQVIEKFNKEYVQVTRGGKLRFLSLITDEYSTLADVRNTYINQTVRVKDKVENQAGVWLKSPNRIIYKGEVFDPSGTSADMLNLYKGLAVEPAKGHWGLFEEHIYENICSGHKYYYEWLIQWMAQLIQEPWAKMGTAVVIKGEKGTGKSIFAETYGRLFGSYFKTLNSGDHVVSRFNSVYERCLLLCADEACWGGNRSSENMLKGIITAPELWIECKGYEGSMKRNFTRLIFTTNSTWAVPASWDERRYLVLEIANNWQKNHKMFSAMSAQMSQGGYGAMLYDLLRKKITCNLRQPPVTKELKEQILLSEPPIKKWLRDWIDDCEDWPQWMNKQAAYLNYADWCRGAGIRYKGGKLNFYKTMESYIPNYKEVQPRSMEQKRCIVLPERSILLKYLGK
jgi:hypothetical protein